MASKVKSTLYSAAGVYSNQILNFVTAAVLARLLDPKDFGLVALLLLVNGFLTLFASAGVSSVIVQFRGLERNDLRALIGLCWIIGMSLTGVAIMAAKPVASFFSAPDLYEVIPVGALALLLTPVSQIVDGVLVRDGCFGLRSTVAVSSALIGSAVGISLALIGYGYWALVIQMVVRPLAALVLGFFCIKMLPIPTINLSLYRKVGKYAANLVGFRFLNYWTQNIDNLLIGRQFGMVDLGYYSRAYTLYNLSANFIQAIAGPILHSSFASASKTPGGLQKEVRESLMAIALISMPVMAIASIFADEIVNVVWGPKWGEAALPFGILAMAGIFRPVLTIPSELLKALGRTGELCCWGMVRLLLYGLAIYIGLGWGISGVALGVAVAIFLNWLVYSNFVLLKRGGLNPAEIFTCYYPALKLFSLVVVTAFVLKYNVLAELSPAFRLCLSVAVFVILVPMYCMLLNNLIWSLIKENLCRLSGRKSRRGI